MTQRVDLNQMRHGTELLKRGFAKMQEGGVIMDVVTAEEAHIAEDSGPHLSWRSSVFQQISAQAEAWLE